MANTPNENLMSELASQMISHIGSFFERINASPRRPIGNFSGENAENYLYVLYSANGLPLFAGVVTTSGGKRGEARAQKEVQALAANGYVASYRTVEFGSENMAVSIERLVSDLFGAALPLSAGNSRDGAEVAAPRRRGRPSKKAADSAAAAPRRRGRPSKKAADGAAAAPRRRGRPSKQAAAVDGTVGEAPRRRGRPRKTEADTAAPARRPGRPRKGAAVADAPKRRPGRPRKNETEAAAPARRPGRPRKNVTEEASAAPRRPGRPRKEGSTRASRAGAGTKRAGRPRGARKGEETGTTE
jgi:hypothetical protein